MVYNFLARFTTGRIPRTAPIQHTNGKIYGVTTSGGPYDRGVFYRLDIGSGTPAR